FCHLLISEASRISLATRTSISYDYAATYAQILCAEGKMMRLLGLFQQAASDCETQRQTPRKSGSPFVEYLSAFHDRVIEEWASMPTRRREVYWSGKLGATAGWPDGACPHDRDRGMVRRLWMAIVSLSW